MLYTEETKTLRREIYDYVTALNSRINKSKAKPQERTLVSGKLKKK